MTALLTAFILDYCDASIGWWIAYVTMIVLYLVSVVLKNARG